MCKTSKMWDKACLFVSKSWLKSKSQKKKKKIVIYIFCPYRTALMSAKQPEIRAATVGSSGRNER